MSSAHSATHQKGTPDVKLDYYLLPLAAYLYGAIPYGLLMAKWIRGVDLREVGSGNIGATNAARVLGFKFFPLVFILDFSKGCLPALAGTMLAGHGDAHSPPPLAVAAGLAGVLGHVFPVYLRFRGGKAVAAGAGMLVVIAPKVAIAAAVVWALVFAVWRYVSLASICAAGTVAASVWFLQDEPLGKSVYATSVCCAAAALIVFLHRANIKRLMAGTEHKIGRKKTAG
jgi:glycerol-3-phosphate acyltransferase PlsY